MPNWYTGVIGSVQVPRGVTAFTIGIEDCYEQAILDNPNTKKLGRMGDYEGGWVWKTFEEAREFLVAQGLQDQYRVYGLSLEGSWETDVSPEPSPKDGVHRLLRDSRIVRLP
jgi:hypothetical protein